MFKLRSALAAVVTVTMGGTAVADIINVCPGDSIQAAIDAAVDGDEIIVAPGTYFETINFLGKAVTLRSSDGPEVTFIDAQQTGTVVTCDTGEGSNTVLDGFTITGGTGTFLGGKAPTIGTPSAATIAPRGPREGWNTALIGTITGGIGVEGIGAQGGGMLNLDSNPTVTHCIFSGNTADAGGGMYNGGTFNAGASPTITACTFIGNSAEISGGAMSNQGNSPTITDCAFIANTVSPGLLHTGGAIFNAGSTVTITGCAFVENIVELFVNNTGGGAIIGFDCTMTISDCTFDQNQALIGGAIAHVESGGLPNHLLLIRDTSLTNNTAGVGGAVDIQDGLALIQDCDIIGNQALNPDFGYGGGVFSNQAASFGSDFTVINSRFSGNFALLMGGAIFSKEESTLSVINSTVTANSSDGAGGGILNEHPNGEGAVVNSIVWANSDVGGSDESAQIELNGGQISVDYSCIQGLTGALGGTGNIGVDPLFVDPDNGDFRLSPGSPCIDAGDNTAVPLEITTDLDGKPRFVDDPDIPDTGNGEPPIVDMGAYEFQGLPCPWDLNGDGNVNVLDLIQLVMSFGPCEGCPADIDEDGIVNVLDLIALIMNFGPCPGTPCVWDVNGDGIVDQSDVQAVISNLGPCEDPENCPWDVNGDGVVNGQDVAAVATHLGPCPQPGAAPARSTATQR